MTTYHSPLRQEQAERTRERILRAIIEEMAAGGVDDFRVGAVAERAGVAERTVYRYFPDRDVVHEALAEYHDAHLDLAGDVDTPEELIEVALELFPLFDEHAELIMARLNSELGRATRVEARRNRRPVIEGALAELLEPLDREEREEVVAAVFYLMSSLAWRTLNEEFAINGERTGKVVARLLRLLFDDLRSRRKE